MNLRDALHVWRRRWILTLLLVLVVLAVSAAAAMKLPRHYTAESNVVLLPSANSTVPNGRNPYLTYNGSLPMTAQILSYQLMDPQTVMGLTARGYTASFTATLAANAASAPILTMLVTGSNRTPWRHAPRRYRCNRHQARRVARRHCPNQPDNGFDSLGCHKSSPQHQQDGAATRHSPGSRAGFGPRHPADG